MSTPERATIRMVGGEPVAAPSPEPEAQPPITTPPPQEFEPDMGGPAVSPPTPDDLVAATGGSLADRLRARYEGMDATEEFSVPGYELPDGRPGLVLVARAFGDRRAFTDGISNEVFIAKSTHQLLLVNDDGSREEIPGGWGPSLAGMIGVNVAKAADLVALVISKPDPNDRNRRIPNVAGIGALAGEIVAWSRQGHREAEEDLGG
jgi:hypothetical protein